VAFSWFFLFTKNFIVIWNLRHQCHGFRFWALHLSTRRGTVSCTSQLIVFCACFCVSESHKMSGWSQGAQLGHVAMNAELGSACTESVTSAVPLPRWGFFSAPTTVGRASGCSHTGASLGWHTFSLNVKEVYAGMEEEGNQREVMKHLQKKWRQWVGVYSIANSVTITVPVTGVVSQSRKIGLFCLQK